MRKLGAKMVPGDRTENTPLQKLSFKLSLSLFVNMYICNVDAARMHTLTDTILAAINGSGRRS